MAAASTAGQRKILHIAPGRSAGTSLAQAVRRAGSNDDVLSFGDDLSCGPIDSDAPSVRAEWWGRMSEGLDHIATETAAFWDRVTATDDRLVVWCGRHSAMELSFFLAWVERLGARPYDIIDVTETRVPCKRPDGSQAFRIAKCVSVLNPDQLCSLFGQGRPLARAEQEEHGRHWQRLRQENAPFRIVTDAGLASAPINHFDPLLLREATREWQRMASVIGQTMGQSCEPYFQVGDLMLQRRVVALVEEGKLRADGDLHDMRTCRIRLPD